jgi:hypothetical protein
LIMQRVGQAFCQIGVLRLKGRSAMNGYRVSFFKNLTSSNGKAFKVCQRAIEIHSARDRSRAIEAAKSRFARLECVGDWKLHADHFDVEPLFWGGGADNPLL